MRVYYGEADGGPINRALSYAGVPAQWWCWDTVTQKAYWVNSFGNVLGTSGFTPETDLLQRFTKVSLIDEDLQVDEGL